MFCVLPWTNIFIPISFLITIAQFLFVSPNKLWVLLWTQNSYIHLQIITIYTIVRLSPSGTECGCASRMSVHVGAHAFVAGSVLYFQQHLHVGEDPVVGSRPPPPPPFFEVGFTHHLLWLEEMQGVDRI
jgi:hypothetical protein